MPIYEYRCKECQQVTEVIQKFNDRPLRTCKACSGRLEKLISRTSFHLRGGGWFDQGYSPGGKGANAKSGGESGDKAKDSTPKSKDAATTSSETKPKKAGSA